MGDPNYPPKAARRRSTNGVVAELRRISKEVARLPPPSDEGIYFPPYEPGDSHQHPPLEGYVTPKQLADILYYIADMLEE